MVCGKIVTGNVAGLQVEMQTVFLLRSADDKQMACVEFRWEAGCL